MQITSLKIASDKTKMDLTITDAASIISLRLWTNKTYKDFTKLIDLSSKLTSSATENIEITPADLGISNFDGIYYVEAEDPTETSIEYTQELSKYQECILLRTLKLTTCIDCLKEKDTILLNLSTLYKSLIFALERRMINQMQLLIGTLDKFCVNKCTTCSGNTKDVTDYENFNPDNL